MNEPQTLRVIDLFAGPGGLAEGFSTTSYGTRYQIVLSVEKEVSAFLTLRLRSLFRHLGDRGSYDYHRFTRGEIDLEQLKACQPQAWRAAENETALLELGRHEDDAELDRRLDAILAHRSDDLIVIGGPPCQAYSLAGRSRNAGNTAYVAEHDQRHFLFREYIRILGKVRPRAFVMENVKGILSSSVAGQRIFDLVTRDLQDAAGPESYRLFSLSADNSEIRPDYVLRAEDFGIPQARHRVIIVGVRNDIAQHLSPTHLKLRRADRPITVQEAIGDLPALRSGLSRSADSFEQWRTVVLEANAKAQSAIQAEGVGRSKVVACLRRNIKVIRNAPALGRVGDAYGDAIPSEYVSRLIVPEMDRPLNHESRSHMVSDLARYAFVAAFAQAEERSPTAREFPKALAPSHESWATGKFADRFRVQVSGRPGTTVTSHIAKDGHYFIHPDPAQCRSLTVREAARLQSFPDNYLFLGNRTAQYVQVGNAVPPLLARQIAEALSRALSLRVIAGGGAIPKNFKRRLPRQAG